MITIEDLFKRLAQGALQNTSLVTEDGTTIEEESKNKVLIGINEALTRLHTKFILKEKELYLEIQEGRTTYPLVQKFAFQSYEETEKFNPFIMDSIDDPFKNDVIKILRVYDNLGNERILNDPRHPSTSVFTPSPEILQLRRTWPRQVLNVVYQAKHKEVGLGENQEQEVYIPDSLMGALDSYTAYWIFNNINNQESIVTAANQLTMFSSLCDEAVMTDSVNSSSSYSSDKFFKNGWV